mmetsp:Transcript_32926/g.87351  ORF Transcript_32926/g.87351 Transcript_32926/m.87351 type:complete len:121 (+) Transcript_32926:38-400(+)
MVAGAWWPFVPHAAGLLQAPFDSASWREELESAGDIHPPSQALGSSRCATSSSGAHKDVAQRQGNAVRWVLSSTFGVHHLNHVYNVCADLPRSLKKEEEHCKQAQFQEEEHCKQAQFHPS